MVQFVALFVSFMLCGCRSVRTPENPPAAHFRVLSYNVNWGGPRPDLAVDIIRTSKADIVCLQETTPQWKDYLLRELGHDYRFQTYRESKGRMGGGLAFLSRLPAREVAYVPSDTGWFDGWIMSFDTGVGTVQVLNVHLRPPVSDQGGWVSGYFSTGDDRMREIQRFYQRRDADVPLLIAGDFNDGEGSGVLRWLFEQGMTNALPQFDRKTPTWEWPTSVYTLKRRMDHIVYSPDLQCYGARVVKAGASDHFPVEAVFGRAER